MYFGELENLANDVAEAVVVRSRIVVWITGLKYSTHTQIHMTIISGASIFAEINKNWQIWKMIQQWFTLLRWSNKPVRSWAFYEEVLWGWRLWLRQGHAIFTKRSDVMRKKVAKGCQEWPAMNRVLENGDIELSNNLCERWCVTSRWTLRQPTT